MIPVELSEPALADWQVAAEWYDVNASESIGDRFRQAVSLLLTEIGERPTSFPAVDDVYRRALTPTFPYAVYFRIEPDRVFIRAIVHGHRNPSRIRRQLDQP